MKIDEIFSNGKKELEAIRFAKETIEKYAQPYINEVGDLRDSVIYRGVRQSTVSNAANPFAFIGTPRKDRSPLQSSQDLHDLAIEIYSDMGVVANRNNSYFVTSDMHAAHEYGEIYIVIPLGEFNYTWEPGFADLYVQIRSAMQSLKPKKTTIKSFFTGQPEYTKDALESVLAPRFDDGSLDMAIRSGNEIMITGGKFLFIHRSIYGSVLDRLYSTGK